MKRIVTIIGALIMTASVWAQSPEKMSYQAVVRDASNVLVVSQTVGMQISILQGGATGTAVYVETQTPMSNANGLVTLEIGSGTIVSGDFTTIDWANDTYFIQTETDPTGGVNYTISGTSQLMSVPYSLHAKSASSLEGTITESQISDLTHTIDTDTQLDEAAVDGFVANNGYLTSEVDGSTTNEIQDLQLVGNNLTITNNGAATTIDLSAYLDDTDTQLDSTDIANMGYVAPVGLAPITISGSIVVPSSGTYVINYGSGYRGIGLISCSIDQVPNGIWNSGGTIAFSEAGNTQDYLLNVVEYQLYSGGNIQAELRPLNAANYDNVGANIDGRVEVEVTSITQPSTLRWSVTVFPASN